MSQHPIERLKEKEENFLYDHPWLRGILSNGFLVIISTLSALVFAFGFNCFMDPGAAILAEHNSFALASGGVSGVGQVIVLFCELCGWKDIDASTAISILYFVVNVPLIILGFLRVGRKFTLFTLINVAETSLFLHLFADVFGARLRGAIGKLIIGDPARANAATLQKFGKGALLLFAHRSSASTPSSSTARR